MDSILEQHLSRCRNFSALDHTILKRVLNLRISHSYWILWTDFHLFSLSKDSTYWNSSKSVHFFISINKVILVSFSFKTSVNRYSSRGNGFQLDKQIFHGRLPSSQLQNPVKQPLVGAGGLTGWTRSRGCWAGLIKSRGCWTAWIKSRGWWQDLIINLLLSG